MNRKKAAIAILCGLLALIVIIMAMQTKDKSAEKKETETVLDNENQNIVEETIEETNDLAENAEPSDENNNSVESNVPDSNKNTSASNNQTEAETQHAIPEENVNLGVERDENAVDNLDESSMTTPSSQSVTPTESQSTEGTPDEPLPADFDITTLTYEQYNAMNGTQQRQVIEMFANVEEFMKWYRAVEAQYKAEHPDIEIGADGVIDAEDLIK